MPSYFSPAVAVESEQFLCWFLPVLEEIKQTLAALPAGIPADKETSKTVVKCFSTVWPSEHSGG